MQSLTIGLSIAFVSGLGPQHLSLDLVKYFWTCGLLQPHSLSGLNNIMRVWKFIPAPTRWFKALDCLCNVISDFLKWKTRISFDLGLKGQNKLLVSNTSLSPKQKCRLPIFKWYRTRSALMSKMLENKRNIYWGFLFLHFFEPVEPGMSICLKTCKDSLKLPW